MRRDQKKRTCEHSDLVDIISPARENDEKPREYQPHHARASANNRPPKTYNHHVLIVITTLRPFWLHTVPASMAPNGPPMAQTETAVAHSIVV